VPGALGFEQILFGFGQLLAGFKILGAGLDQLTAGGRIGRQACTAAGLGQTDRSEGRRPGAKGRQGGYRLGADIQRFRLSLPGGCGGVRFLVTRLRVDGRGKFRQCLCLGRGRGRGLCLGLCLGINRPCPDRNKGGQADKLHHDGSYSAELRLMF
jgi:hypothetical protein